MAIAFHFAARSDVGMVRSNNEDSGYAGPHLLALADGMGGHAGGEVASSTVIAALVSLDGEALSGAEATDQLLRKVAEANAEIGSRVRERPELEGMGTTLIALLRADNKLVLAHIGDSRAFLARGGRITQITKDHSFVQSLVDGGRISLEDAMTHPQRSLVTRVLTGNPTDEPDIVVRRARVGDRYLIASDGLTDYVARETIDAVTLQAKTPAEAVDKLVQLSLRAGAPDNVTIVVGDVVDLRVGPVPPDQPIVVGAAAAPRKGTRPIPVTPAEKAAALSQEAAGHGEEHDDEVTLAEEGPASRWGRIGRVIGSVVAAAVVLAGISYAAWLWSQHQYWVGVEKGYVTVFRGVDQTIGPLSLSTTERSTTIRVDDLPSNYQVSLAEGVAVASRAAADRLVSSLTIQSAACVWAKAHGEDCRTVPDTWTPSPSPSESPSGSAPTSPGRIVAGAWAGPAAGPAAAGPTAATQSSSSGDRPRAAYLLPGVRA